MAMHLGQYLVLKMVKMMAFDLQLWMVYYWVLWMVSQMAMHLGQYLALKRVRMMVYDLTGI